MVDSVFTQLKASNFEGKTKKQVFDRIASDANDMIKQVREISKNEQQKITGQEKTVQTQATGITPVSTGGQGGAGDALRQGAGQPQGPAGIEVFD